MMRCARRREPPSERRLCSGRFLLYPSVRLSACLSVVNVHPSIMIHPLIQSSIQVFIQSSIRLPSVHPSIIHPAIICVHMFIPLVIRPSTCPPVIRPSSHPSACVVSVHPFIIHPTGPYLLMVVCGASVSSRGQSGAITTMLWWQVRLTRHRAAHLFLC